MASALLRRSAFSVAAATLAAVCSPFVLPASAADMTGTVTSKPAPDSNGVVHANRPQLIGTFSDDLKSGSTIVVYDKADANKTNLCGPAAIDGSDAKKVECTVAADLDTSKTYESVAHGVRASDGATADTAPFDFKVDYPVFDPSASSPPPNESAPVPAPKIVAAFSEGVTGDQNSFKVYELNPDNTRGNGPLPGTVSFPTTGTPAASNKTAAWQSGAGLVDGKYEAVVSVNGVNSDGSANKDAVGNADYYFYVATGGPQNLSAPKYANNQNITAFPFSGTGPQGAKVTIDVPTGDPVTDNAGNEPGGSGIIPDCQAVVSCPWTVTVDLSALDPNSPMYDPASSPTDADGQRYDWTATIGNKTADGPPFTVETDSPDKPTNGKASISPDGLTVTATADPPAACNDPQKSLGQCSGLPIVGYQVTITDPSGHSVSKEFDTTGSLVGDVDVSSLNNGDLDVQIMTITEAGNVSSPYQNPPDPNPTHGHPAPYDPSVTKNAVFAPNFATSHLTNNSGDVDFTTAEGKATRGPSTITVEFNQPIKITYTPSPTATNPQPAAKHSFACVTFPSGNCDTTITVGEITATPDGYGLTFPVGAMSDGQHGLQVITYSDGCPSTLTSGTTCNTYTGQPVRDASKNNAVFLFTVDNTPPQVAITSLNAITPQTLQTAAVSGTADNDVNVVQLSFKSSADPTHTRVATAPVSNGQWTLQPLPLSGVPDGTLTVTAKGTDAAGNVGTATKSTSLSGLNLNVIAGDSAVLLTWTTPTLANNAQPAYTVTEQDLTTGTAANLVSPPPASNATSFRIPNLANGHNYAFTLKATDPNGNGPVAIKTATPKARTALTATTTSSRIVYGRTVVLSGKLTDASGAPITGAPVTITPVYSSTRTGGSAHRSTDANGIWGLATKPIANVTYIVTYAGDAAHLAARAGVHITTVVAIKITSVTSSSSSHTAAVKIAGTVGPNEHGRHVYIYKITSTGAHRVAMLTLSSKSTFSWTHVWSKGTYTVFARFYSQNYVTGADSNKVKFTRK